MRQALSFSLGVQGSIGRSRCDQPPDSEPMSAALAAALRARGVVEPDASLLMNLCTAVLRLANNANV